MECHQCKHRKAVESGRYAVAPYEETPCAKCGLEDASIRTLESDDGRPAFIVGADEGTDPLEIVAPMPYEEPEERLYPISVLTELVQHLMALPQDVRDVVCMRVQGLTYRQIARRQGLTTAGAEARHERGMSLFPPLRELFARKMVKRGLRRKAGAAHA
ncbi:MAG: sigma factor-like helix-turn-helix DNA-binding protein [bacterium]